MVKDYSDKPVIIVGAARSGTSMVGGVVNICGAWKGNTVGPGRYNAKGMFENHELREKILKPLLHSMNVDKLGQYPLPETKDVLIPYDLQESIIKIIKGQGWSKEKPWMWKCAKACLIWPGWVYAFPNAKWIIVRRKTSDIIQSCFRTGFMNKYARPEIQRKVGAKNEKEGWLYWVRKHEEKFIEIIQEGVNVKVIWPERMVNSDYQQMQETIEWLGLEWKPKEVMDFITPKLWKGGK